MARRKEYRDDPLTYSIIGCAIAVHKKLGPGLVESIYDDCFNAELESGGFAIRRQPRVNVGYEGMVLDRTFRPDYVINDEVVVEIKSVAHLLPVHQAQLLTYMKLAEIERGLIINFNVAVLASGVKRLILSLPRSSDLT